MLRLASLFELPNWLVFSIVSVDLQLISNTPYITRRLTHQIQALLQQQVPERVPGVDWQLALPSQREQAKEPG
jgi:hypothetical protein